MDREKICPTVLWRNEHENIQSEVCPQKCVSLTIFKEIRHAYMNELSEMPDLARIKEVNK